MAAAGATSVIANLKLLNHDNYEEWSVRVKTYLLTEDLWDVVEGTTELPKREDNEAEYKAWRKNDAKALYAIQSSCRDDTCSFIRTITRAKDAWDTLLQELKPADQEIPEETSDSEVQSADTRTNDVEPIDVPGLTDDAPTDDLETKANVGEEGSEINSVDARTEDVGTDGDEPTYSEGAVESETNDEEEIIAFFVYLVESNDWDAAMKFVKQYPKVACARLSDGGTALHSRGGTALHAATLQKKGDVAIELVKLMTPIDLEIADNEGYIALHNVVLRSPPDNFELVKLMVETNKNLLSIPGPRDGRTSLLLAQMMESGERVARYLYSLIDPLTLQRQEASDLICQGLQFKRYDIAWDLIQRDVSLALEIINGNCPYTQLARLHPEAFLSGTKLSFWEKWIYNRIFIKPSPTTNEIRITVGDKEKKKDNPKGHLSSGLFRGLHVGYVKNLNLFGIKRIYRLKFIHVRVREFLGRMCEVIKPGVLKNEQLPAVYKGIFLAIERGHIEFVSRTCQTNPVLLRAARNENDQSIFQAAAENRDENIFNLIFLLDEGVLRDRVRDVDFSGNNILHMIGSYSPFSRINRIQGPALQMQRALQWYKEVESIAGQGVLQVPNYRNKTPRNLFIETHKDLMIRGEESMKDTANSCMVVGALIVTMMFAAAFTVPGGNNGDTGHPIFLYDKIFKIFMVADVISLSTSTTSVIVFLGILTSRFSENDFVISLPTRMILGLSSLFISISAMMVAFCAAMFIMLHGNLAIAILTTTCLTLPIFSFVWMEFPFLVEIFNSTYRSEIIGKNVQRWT